jgi:mevalonate kinase
MPAFTASAPGKIILFGEHAVVYGEPALAVPVHALRARAVVSPRISAPSGEIKIEAPDIDFSTSLAELPEGDPIFAALTAAAGEDRLAQVPACRIRISSTIPPSSGLGSSAAVSAALIRAFSAFLGKRLSDQEVSDLTFRVEKIHHGTPSGIDNSVVTFQKPVFFQSGNPIEFLTIPEPFEILIADSGVPGNTRLAVEKVRQKHNADPSSCNRIFSEIGDISRHARDLLTAGQAYQMGELMDRNQTLLKELGVSSPELDHLVEAALQAGALGAKLSGGGLGGHLILLTNDDPLPLKAVLLQAGAANVFSTSIGV